MTIFWASSKTPVFSIFRQFFQKRVTFFRIWSVSWESRSKSVSWPVFFHFTRSFWRQYTEKIRSSAHRPQSYPASSNLTHQRIPQVLCLVNFGIFHNNNFLRQNIRNSAFFANSQSDPGWILLFWRLFAFSAPSSAVTWSLGTDSFRRPFPDQSALCIKPASWAATWSFSVTVLTAHRTSCRFNSNVLAMKRHAPFSENSSYPELESCGRITDVRPRLSFSWPFP